MVRAYAHTYVRLRKKKRAKRTENFLYFPRFSLPLHHNYEPKGTKGHDSLFQDPTKERDSYRY